MKFLKSAGGRITFQVDAKEKEILFQLLKAYPILPAAHHRQQLSKTEDRPDDQQLLDEALASQRRKSAEKVDRWLRLRSRPGAKGTKSRFSIKLEELEWILQVLNDLRVGSWLLMGSPDGLQETLAALNENTAPCLWVMEAAGAFQMMFLRSASGGDVTDEKISGGT